MCDLVKASCRVEAGSNLVGNRLIVDESMHVCRADGLFIKAFGVDHAAFNPGNLGANERCPIFEILRAMLRPDLELSVVRSQRLQMLPALVGRSGVAGCSARKCAVKVIFSLFEKG